MAQRYGAGTTAAAQLSVDDKSTVVCSFSTLGAAGAQTPEVKIHVLLSHWPSLHHAHNGM